MRPILVLIILSMAFSLLTACGSGAPAVATLVPTVLASDGANDDADDESPRTEDSAPSERIPPTWTPAPAADAIPAQQPALATRPPEETGESYVVQPGDTLAEIAQAFGVDLDRLASANNIQNIDYIFSGQVLTIPR